MSGFLSEVDWKDSQVNEAGFWKSQFKINNQEQIQRNTYYKGLLEDGNSIAKDFFNRDFSNAFIADVGSGPQGILHTIDARVKVAIDPLMNEFREQGYKVENNGVICICDSAEFFQPVVNHTCYVFDYITCLNSLDHMQNPEQAIANMSFYMLPGAELLLITDLRTPGQLDAYHKLSITEEDVLGWLDPFFVVLKKQNYPHQAGNPVRQLIVHAKK